MCASRLQGRGFAGALLRSVVRHALLDPQGLALDALMVYADPGEAGPNHMYASVGFRAVSSGREDWQLRASL